MTKERITFSKKLSLSKKLTLSKKLSLQEILDFVHTASLYHSEINIRANIYTVNAKSILGFTSFIYMLKEGSSLVLMAKGHDADAALEELLPFVSSEEEVLQ